MRYAYAAVIALTAAFIISAFSDSQSNGMLRRGDFPAFYSAGQLALDGRGEELYSREAHREIQNRAWPSLDGAQLLYAYPPTVAFFAAPFSFFDPLVAKIAFTLLMALAAYLAFSIQGQGRYFPLFLLFAPLLAGIAAGQLVGLMLLIYAVLLKKEQGPFYLGLMSGLWCFKPQYGVLLFVLLLLLKPRASLLIGFSLGIAAVFASSAVVSGVDWLWIWLPAASQFSEVDLQVNAHQMVNVMAVLVSGLKLFGIGVHWAKLCWVLLAATIFIYCYRCLRDKGDTRLALLAFPAIALIISPHALFYDLALLIPGFIYLEKEHLKGNLWKIYLLFVLVFISALAREYMLINPLVFVPIAYLYLVLKEPQNAR